MAHTPGLELVQLARPPDLCPSVLWERELKNGWKSSSHVSRVSGHDLALMEVFLFIPVISVWD